MADELAKQANTPKVGELAKEFTRAGGYYNFRQTRSRADEVRYSYWAGQHTDGKKHQENDDDPVFPWDGASDTRIRLADEITTENAEILTSAFWRATLQAAPTEAKDTANAAKISTLLQYYRDNVLKWDLQQEVSLSAQGGQHYGVNVIHPFWERTLSSKPTQVTIQGLIELGMQDQDGPLSSLPSLIADSEMEDSAVEIIQEIIDISTTAARKAVRQLRETGETEVDLPYVTENKPRIVSLKVGEEVFLPPETVEVKEARVIFYRDWFTETELDEKVRTDGWNQAWVTEVLKAPNRQSRDHASRVTDYGFNENPTNDAEDNIFEVVTAYQRVTGEDGVPKIMLTVFHPLAGNKSGDAALYALHREAPECMGEYPFFPYRREWLTRKVMDSRGVPELCATWQNEIKGQRDSLYDRASLNTLPPFTVPQRLGAIYELRPGAAIPELRKGEVSFMDPPKSNPAEALEVVRYVEEQAARYFGRPHPNVDPALAQVKRQHMVENFLGTWSKVWAYTFKLMQQYLTDEDVYRITGVESGLPESPMEIAGNYDISVSFDVRELDNEFLLKKMDIISKAILPEDSAGVIDRATLTKWKMASLDPQLAQILVQDKEGASQKLFEQVRNDVAMMALGNPPPLVEADPTANTKLEFLSQVIQSNPKYQQALQEGGDPVFAELLQKYQDNLSMSVKQESNKAVGRLGVSPM